MYSQQTVHSSETSIINLHLSVKKTDWKVAAMKISHDSTCTVTVSAETDCCDWTSRTTTWHLAAAAIVWTGGWGWWLVRLREIVGTLFNLLPGRHTGHCTGAGHQCSVASG